MHTCPECGQACSCNGDIDDIVWGEDDGCEHYKRDPLCPGPWWADRDEEGEEDAPEPERAP